MTAISIPEPHMKQIRRACSLALLALALLACQPKVGSEAWCKAMNDKPKGDWTVNEAADFAKSCIIK
jgi:hypothetical protein